MPESLLIKTINEFYDNIKPEKALQMEKYLLNQFKCLGIQRPERNKLQKEYKKFYKTKKAVDWNVIKYVWELEEREFQYFAIDLLEANVKYMSEDDLTHIGELIVDKSWWDTVDSLSTKVVGVICYNNPKAIETYIIPWSKSNNIWLSRIAILFQLKYKLETDTALLEQVILENKDTDEFFLNKAIGWILREYSKSNPDWVASLFDKYDFKALTIREGSKYLVK